MFGGLFSRLKEGLTKTRQGFVEKVENLLKGHKKISEEMFEELEEVLIQADVGVQTTMKIVGDLRRMTKERKLTEAEQIRELLKEELIQLIGKETPELNVNANPTVIMVVGVNGAGKTTTIGKLANRFKDANKKVLLAAGDTFRAAAIDQLEIWSKRAAVEIIRHQEGADPAAVAYDAIQAARARKADILIIDTAGRLHTQTNLMEELKKVKRVITREMQGAPHEVLQVIDATVGQNAISQVKLFGEAVDVTGLVLTKLDGTAKGGIVVAIKNELSIPVKLIGIGEKIEDLRDFNGEEFIQALFSE